MRNLDAARIEILRDLDALTLVIDAFLEDAPGLLETLRGALASGDFSTAEKTAHRLKGSSANLGATLLSASFERLETLAREGDAELCREQLAQVETAYRAAKEELEEIRARERGD